MGKFTWAELMGLAVFPASGTTYVSFDLSSVFKIVRAEVDAQFSVARSKEELRIRREALDTWDHFKSFPLSIADRRRTLGSQAFSKFLAILSWATPHVSDHGREFRVAPDRFDEVVRRVNQLLGSTCVVIEALVGCVQIEDSLSDGALSGDVVLARHCEELCEELRHCLRHMLRISPRGDILPWSPIYDLCIRGLGLRDDILLELVGVETTAADIRHRLLLDAERFPYGNAHSQHSCFESRWAAVSADFVEQIARIAAELEKGLFLRACLAARRSAYTSSQADPVDQQKLEDEFDQKFFPKKSS